VNEDVSQDDIKNAVDTIIESRMKAALTTVSKLSKLDFVNISKGDDLSKVCTFA